MRLEDKKRELGSLRFNTMKDFYDIGTKTLEGWEATGDEEEEDRFWQDLTIKDEESVFAPWFRAPVLAIVRRHKPQLVDWDLPNMKTLVASAMEAEVALLSPNISKRGRFLLRVNVLLVQDLLDFAN